MIEGKILPQEILHLVCCNLFVVDCIAEIDVEGDLLLFQVVPVRLILVFVFDRVEIVARQLSNLVSFRCGKAPGDVKLQPLVAAISILNFCRQCRRESPHFVCVRIGILDNLAPCQVQLFRHGFIQRYPTFLTGFSFTGFTFINSVLQTDFREEVSLARPVLCVVVVLPVDVLLELLLQALHWADFFTDKSFEVDLFCFLGCQRFVFRVFALCIKNHSLRNQICRQSIYTCQICSINQDGDSLAPLFPGFNSNIVPGEGLIISIPLCLFIRLLHLRVLFGKAFGIEILLNLHRDSTIRAFRLFFFSAFASLWGFWISGIVVGHRDGVLYSQLTVIGINRRATVCNFNFVRITGLWLLGLLLAAQRQAQRALLGHTLGAILLFVCAGINGCSNGDRSYSRGICRGRHRCRRKGRADIDLPLGEALVADDGLLVQRHGKAEVGDALRL